MTTTVTPLLRIPDLREELAKPAPTAPGAWVPLQPMIDVVNARVREQGLATVAAQLHVSQNTVLRLQSGSPMRFATINLVDQRLRILAGAYYDRPKR